MMISLHTASLSTTLAVTYRCNDGHHDVRYYAAGLPVDRTVTCVFCGKSSVIPIDELERHARLLDTLAERLV
jgi:hypothetical protein